jgi:hypothetical protein
VKFFGESAGSGIEGEGGDPLASGDQGGEQGADPRPGAEPRRLVDDLRSATLDGGEDAERGAPQIGPGATVVCGEAADPPATGERAS